MTASLLRESGIFVLILVTARVLTFFYTLFFSPGSIAVQLMNVILGHTVPFKAISNDNGVRQARSSRRSHMNMLGSALIMAACLVSVVMVPGPHHAHKSRLASSSLNSTSASESSSTRTFPDFVGFSKSFIMILVAECGDKTFFVAMILAMKYDKTPVFVGSMIALCSMTILSVACGWLISGMLDRVVLLWIGAAIFLVAGVWMLWEAYNMDDSGSAEEEAREAVDKVDLGGDGSASEKGEAAGEMCPAVPSLTPRSSHECCSFWKVVSKAFALLGIAEFGDRTQIATVLLTVDYEPVSVAAGVILAFALVTLAAVFLGGWVAGVASERTLLL
eukprot:CAMPEP_0113694158 /NCGR_PEP_ID=MMETSP0038_2-20120614/20106_1 /TAXON_ID=2898 /ORGANISM="Cryptomonas paramecium" /LENGTH=332 /DNA_ID=CAMNT_0000616393 /DNA_START=69 /DNA_END=1064 /DNA_ORIENTATION=- /assembly_acc=CAM_ASM_000170